MTESIARAPEGMHTITPHIVVSERNVPRREIEEAAAAMFG